ncbi:MAG: sulfurtransferase [Halieaceae bacterium]
MLIDAQQLEALADVVVFDCRFVLTDPAAGRLAYQAGHIPGAHYLDLNNDLSATAGKHGGRHPLPEPADFAATLARFGVDVDTDVVVYDDSRLAFASRLWWMMRALGYRAPRVLNGGLAAWLAGGGELQTESPAAQSCEPPQVQSYGKQVDIEGLRQAQMAGALLVDSREAARYQGLEEPIDPVAGHIPGAINRPWQGVTETDGRLQSTDALRDHWGDALEAEQLVVYCGSGVTACVNLFSLALLGRDDASLYGGSWSDWCSYLQPD